MLERLARGPGTVRGAGGAAADCPQGVSRHFRVLREVGLGEDRQEAQRRSTVTARSRWPRAMHAWAGAGPCGNIGWMPCAPRLPGGTGTKEHQMTSNTRIV